jgi:hypothetical protein
MTAQVFNPAQTIKTINKELLLKSVYNAKNNPFNYAVLIDQANRQELSSDILESLSNIFINAISQRESYLTDYDKFGVADKSPRRYGKVHIQNDIKSQDGESNELQKTMLALNDMKSMVATLIDKGTSDRYKGTNKITEEEGRAIRAAIRNFKTKTSGVLKRKK